MAKPAVQFVAKGTKLLLVYRPRDDTSWVHNDFANGKPLDIKGTYHLTKADLTDARSVHAADNLDDYEPFEVTFVVANARGDYFFFKPEVVKVDVPVLVARNVTPTWKWFSAEEKVSVLRLLADLRPSRIVIGGNAPDAIPIAEYERIVAQFPSAYELKRYVQSRLGIVFRELTDAKVDAEGMLRK